LNRVLLLLGKSAFSKKNEIFSAIEKIDFSTFIAKKTTFAARCERIGSHEFSSQEIEGKTGEIIIEKTKKEKKYTPKVELENPDATVYVYIFNNECYIGIDLIGFDLSKRQYRVFVHPTSLKATIAFCLLKIADIKQGQKILNPFCGDGTIPIEAALHLSGFSVNYYNKDKFAFLKLKQFKDIDLEKFDEKTFSVDNIYGYDSLLRNVKAAQKNAKIAGINKLINFSKIDIEWLDTKFGKGEIEKIITFSPSLTKRKDKKELEKLYKEFFYQADFILEKKGVIVMVTKSPQLIKEKALEAGFKVAQELETAQGKEKLAFFVIERKP
jgi:23S rRNA G2445 N2-methylase RlmL